jgi:hypothetical protein
MIGKNRGRLRQRKATEWRSSFRCSFVRTFAVTVSLASLAGLTGLAPVPGICPGIDKAYADDTGWKSVTQLPDPPNSLPLLLGNFTTGYDLSGYDIEQFAFDLNYDPDEYATFTDYNYGDESGLSFVTTIGTYHSVWDHYEYGPSTYFWHWTPPEIPSAYASMNYFATPDLFLFATLDPDMSVTTTSPPNTISASIDLDAGTGFNGWNYHSGTLYPPTDEAKIPSTSLPIRGIVKATPYGTNTGTVSQVLDPTAQLHVECPPYAGEGTVTFRLTRSISAILLDLPGYDVFGLPQIGDGTNQFTYSTDSTGVLEIPLKVKVEGSTEAEGTYLRNKVNLAYLPSAIPGTQSFSWDKIPGGGGVKIITVLPDLSTTDTIVVAGLPSSNNDFGTRTLQLQVNNQNSQKAYIQTFFPATATNNPGGINPNWYYYYSQYISGVSAYYPGVQGYDSSSGASRFNWPGGTITIRDDAHTYPSLRIFSRSGPGNSIVRIGDLQVKGIHSYLVVAGHEAGHKYYYNNSVYVPTNDSGGSTTTTPNPSDLDQDGVDDAWEIEFGLNPNSRDSTIAYDTDGGDGYNASGDSQLIADVYSYSLLKNNKDAWKQDWANDGLQFGVKNFLGSDFPWKYVTGGSDMPDPPSTALTVNP